jgi:hypothetical protein
MTGAETKPGEAKVPVVAKDGGAAGAAGVSLPGGLPKAPALGTFHKAAPSAPADGPAMEHPSALEPAAAPVNSGLNKDG